jgi:hypothetical protein
MLTRTCCGGGRFLNRKQHRFPHLSSQMAATDGIAPSKKESGAQGRPDRGALLLLDALAYFHPTAVLLYRNWTPATTFQIGASPPTPYCSRCMREYWTAF